MKTPPVMQNGNRYSRLAALKDRLLDALYPPDAVCFACDNEAVLDERYLCAVCSSKIIGIENPPCPEGLDGVSAGLLYNDGIRPAIYRFKYGEAQYIARPLARFLRLPAGCAPDYIVPVPLHPKRLQARGFNQSELLARAFSLDTGIPMHTAAIIRAKQTMPQASLHIAQRASNVSGAFQAREVQGKRILLVDDIFTTGSTLVACATALRHAGAIAVYAACVCAAPHDHQA